MVLLDVQLIVILATVQHTAYILHTLILAHARFEDSQPQARQGHVQRVGRVDGTRPRLLSPPSPHLPNRVSPAHRPWQRARSMVYLPPPHLASETRPSYGEAYAKILATHRRSPATSASSVIILVSPDVDALCAAQMLAELFKQDDVMYRIVPISSHTEFENMRDELATYADVRIITTPSGVSG